MESVRRVGIVMTPVESDEAPGVTIRRTIGSDKFIYLDPFLLHDHLTASGSEVAREIGFPRHPHRGIETVTYVCSGSMNHQDSLGNNETVGAGATQFMTAGSGIYHSEMAVAADDGSGHESIQIWVNLPAAQKMIPADYRAAHASDIPTFTLGGATVRLIAGTIGDQHGPIQNVKAGLTYADVVLPSGADVTLPAAVGLTAYAYILAGRVLSGNDGREVDAAHLAIFADGDSVHFANRGETSARLLFATAHPLNEPVLQYRSLVMNTVEEMRQAVEDLESGRFTSPQ